MYINNSSGETDVCVFMAAQRFILLVAAWGGHTIQRKGIVVFPCQQWLRESPIMLHNTYNALLFHTSRQIT